jgi:[ribosomal protein S5]-alanine N-acetyltransferase
MQIETRRLLLREFWLEDVDALAPILADPQVMEYSLAGVLSVEQTKEKIASFIRCYQEFGFGKWGVVLKQSDELIGYCGLAVESIDNRDEIELGYRFDSRFWGQGLATEAAAAVLKHGF